MTDSHFFLLVDTASKALHRLKKDQHPLAAQVVDTCLSVAASSIAAAHALQPGYRPRKVEHADLVARLAPVEPLAVLFYITESKAGRHVDLLSTVPAELVQEAERAITALIDAARAAGQKDPA